MEAGTGALELRPLRVTEVVDRAVRLYARNALVVWRIVVPLLLVVEAVFTLIDLSALPSGSFVQNGQLYAPAGSATGTYNAAVVIESIVLSLVVLQVINGALVRVYSDTFLGRRPDSQQAVRFALRHLLGLVWIGVIVGVAVLLGLIAILIGAIYLWVMLSLSFAAYVVEGKRGFAALGRSQDLVRGRWWATFGALLLVLIIIAIAAIVLPAILAALESGSNPVSPTAYVILLRLANLIVYTVAGPLSASVTVTIYFDLRVRKEAFDLQQLGERLGITGVAPAAAVAAPAPALAAEPSPAAAPAPVAPAPEPSGEDPFGTGYT
jgi:hypothetical protein